MNRNTCGTPLKFIDSEGERCAEHRCVHIHLRGEVKLAATRKRQRGAKHPAGVFEHEVYLFGGDFLGSDNEIAFVFTILVVNHNHHFPLAEILKGTFD